MSPHTFHEIYAKVTRGNTILGVILLLIFSTCYSTHNGDLQRLWAHSMMRDARYTESSVYNGLRFVCQVFSSL